MLKKQLVSIFKRRERASRNGSTVVKIFIPPPSFKPVSLSLSRSPLFKTPKQVFFNPIHILTSFTTLFSYYYYKFTFFHFNVNFFNFYYRPYSKESYSGFGWFIPSAKYKLRQRYEGGDHPVKLVMLECMMNMSREFRKKNNFFFIFFIFFTDN